MKTIHFLFIEGLKRLEVSALRRKNGFVDEASFLWNGESGMAVFVYRAIDRSHSMVEGTISADSPRQARDELRTLGLSVRELEVQKKAGRASGWNLSFGKRNQQQAALAIRELATLLGAGIPLLQALETIELQHKGSFLTTLTVIHDHVKSGGGLADAFAQHPDIFDTLSVSMVEVGEETGALDEVLGQLADFKERSSHMKDRVVAALTYPLFLVVVMVGITVFLMTVVLPNLLNNLITMGQKLPWPTRVIKGASDFLISYGVVMMVVLAIVLFGVGMFIKTPRGKEVWHRFLLTIPLLGEISKKQALAKMSLILSTLLKSGLVFDKAARITADAMENVIIQNALRKVNAEVGAGQEMGVAFEKDRVFPPVLVQIFRVGQESGQLEPMLDRLARDYDRQVESATDRMASLIEPILILLLAAVVGIIMAAVVLPILEAGKVV